MDGNGNDADDDDDIEADADVYVGGIGVDIGKESDGLEYIDGDGTGWKAEGSGKCDPGRFIGAEPGAKAAGRGKGEFEVNEGVNEDGVEIVLIEGVTTFTCIEDDGDDDEDDADVDNDGDCEDDIGVDAGEAALGLDRGFNGPGSETKEDVPEN
jgi:hypothetical protein